MMEGYGLTVQRIQERTRPASTFCRWYYRGHFTIQIEKAFEIASLNMTKAS